MSMSAAVKRFWCSRCGARPGLSCSRENGGLRKSAHIERVCRSRQKPLTKKRNTAGISNAAWAVIRAQVFASKGCACHYCGGAASHVDHIIPVSLGGTNALSNLVPSCSKCNVGKGANVA